ncbi:hypothetical protein GCM10007940_44070 [Portibacter lacus]|uniref:beta-N-acetylhexosaminidase n=2 Tax=Portibacter lacus TaxID=1099794 RepID=A0AA37SVV8_9BACT|nr:hypothetical protein GCM10007940_44070 [Portibacter lacus]
MLLQGSSSLNPESINSYYSENNETVRGIAKLFKKIENEKDSPVKITIDDASNINTEGYHLKIDNEKISITAKDNAGAMYGLITLSQLIQDAVDQNVNLPMVDIEDFPLLAYRAIHLDVKHHMETLDYYYELMDRLAAYKINGIIAEVEDKIKYVRQPKVASEDALTIEEWEKLSKYAKERNIEISPLVQGIGHASFVLKHDEYRELRDDPESDWAFNPLDPKTYEVQFDLYLDALEALPDGKYLHIGGDEVHTSGRQSEKSALELQLIWLDKVCKFAEEQGRIPIFWDDMPLKHANVYRPMFDRNISPEKVDSIWETNEHELVKFIDKFPKNCVYMRWNYQTPETYGNLKAMEWFSSHGFQVMGATAGQTRWSLMPQNEGNISNIRSFALSSIEKNLDGLLLTLWDDDSPHFELYIRGIIAFSEYTWSGDQRTKEEFKEAYRQRTFGSEFSGNEYAFIDRLEGPVAHWKNALLIEGKQRNQLRKLEDPLSEASIELPSKNAKGEWAKKHEKRLENARKQLAELDTVEQRIALLKKESNRNPYTLEMYEQVTKLVQFSYEGLLKLETYDLATGDTENAALEDIKKMNTDFDELREKLETVYAKARVLNKPANYILDQDHHTHNANQSLNFDWQFYPEMLLLEKIQTIE